MKVICILGPTASGKSALAMEAARRLGGDIINADSMQVYRGLGVGTGVPPAEWMAEVPHHLYQYLDPDQEPDAASWARAAAAVIERACLAGRVPLVVGGTFFWVRALFEGLSQIPPVPREVRQRLNTELASHGLPALYERLRRADPRAAARLAPGDTQRILRALEVFEATGTPLSTFHEGLREPAVRAEVLKVGLAIPREDLIGRIERRVDEMLASGLVEEVRAVLASGVPSSARPLRSASYRPVVGFLAKDLDEHTMRDEVARAHRRYARRQVTWLRREPGLHWVDARDREGALARMRAFLDGQVPPAPRASPRDPLDAAPHRGLLVRGDGAALHQGQDRIP